MLQAHHRDFSDGPFSCKGTSGDQNMDGLALLQPWLDPPRETVIKSLRVTGGAGGAGLRRGRPEQHHRCGSGIRTQLLKLQQPFVTSKATAWCTVAAGEAPGDSTAVPSKASSASRTPAVRPSEEDRPKLSSLCRQGAPEWVGEVLNVLYTFHGSPFHYTSLLQPQISPIARPPCLTAAPSPHFLFLNLSVCTPNPIPVFQCSCMMVLI